METFIGSSTESKPIVFGRPIARSPKAIGGCDDGTQSEIGGDGGWKHAGDI